MHVNRRETSYLCSLDLLSAHLFVPWKNDPYRLHNSGFLVLLVLLGSDNGRHLQNSGGWEESKFMVVALSGPLILVAITLIGFS